MICTDLIEERLALEQFPVSAIGPDPAVEGRLYIHVAAGRPDVLPCAWG